jgi:hypothetical protein
MVASSFLEPKFGIIFFNSFFFQIFLRNNSSCFVGRNERQKGSEFKAGFIASKNPRLCSIDVLFLGSDLERRNYFKK